MPLASENLDRFAELIRQWRKSRGLTQEQLGEQAGLSQHQVSFIENGRSRPARGTVERMADILCVPPRDGNRLLNLLGYSGSIEEPTSHWHNHTPVLEQFMRLLLQGVLPHPASIGDDRHRMVRMNLTQALWMNRFADIPEIFEDGFLSYPRLVYHPKGLRLFMDDWEAHAAGYIQVIHRERLRNPVVGERLYNEILRLTDLPPEWRELNDEVSGTTGQLMRMQTRLGPISMHFMTLYVSAPPIQPSIHIPEFFLSVNIPADDEATDIMARIHAAVTPDQIHKILQPALVVPR